MIDNTKWSEIYNNHSKKMLGICKRYVNDLSLAEDLMHEGFMVAMQKQNTFSGFGSFEGWLRTIMVNTSLIYLRNNKKTLFISDIEIPDNNAETIEMSSTTNIKNKIINTDFTQQELFDVVETISEHHKIVFNMYVIDKFSHNEISKILNITINTSKSHLLRARKKIQELLYLKATEKEQKKSKRKLFFWFFISSTFVDSIYANSFSTFEQMPSKIFDINNIIKQQNLPEKITSGYIYGLTLQKITIAGSIIFVIFGFLYYSNLEKKESKNETDLNDFVNLKKDTIVNELNVNDLTKDSVNYNQTNGLINTNQKNSAIQISKKALDKKAEKIEAKGKMKSTISDKSMKTDIKKKQKKSVVVKKIIDTIYVDE